jgi:preprotein translocase subunit SecG
MTKVVALMLIVMFIVFCVVSIFMCVYVAAKTDERKREFEINKQKFNKKWNEYGFKRGDK